MFRNPKAILVVLLAGLSLLLLVVIGMARAAPSAKVRYVVYNFSGQPAVAATLSGSDGFHGADEHRIADGDFGLLGEARQPGRDSTLTLEWIAGAGRARWKQATLPLTMQGRGWDQVELFIRPDGFVCVSLGTQLESSYTKAGLAQAKAQEDRARLSCAQPRVLPAPAPLMASGFDTGTSTHSWDNYDHGGKSTLINRTLTHGGRSVALRFGYDYKQRPDYLSEFKDVRMLGNDAALLVTANLAPGRPGLFLLTADRTSWQSRFLGAVPEGSKALSGNRLVFGTNRVVVDTKTAEVFVLPRFGRIDWFILGDSPDGRSLAIYWQESRLPDDGGRALNYGVAALDLETGEQLKVSVADIPPLAQGQTIYTFYDDWYRRRCEWKQGLTCR